MKRKEPNKNKPRYVYALVDPRDSRVKYIGCSFDPETRLKDHHANTNGYVTTMIEGGKEPTPVYQWMYELKQAGEEPLMVTIEKCPARMWQSREKFWIIYLDYSGAELTNVRWN